MRNVLVNFLCWRVHYGTPLLIPRTPNYIHCHSPAKSGQKKKVKLVFSKLILLLLRKHTMAGISKFFRKIMRHFWRLMWSACHKKSYLTNLEVRNLKSEISCLCPVWLSQFCLFWKKMGKGFVNIPKFINLTHNNYLFLWHTDHINQWKRHKTFTMIFFS